MNETHRDDDVGKGRGVERKGYGRTAPAVQMQLPGQELQPQEPSAPAVVAAVCDALSAEGIPLARAQRAVVGRHAKTLLADGFDFEVVVVAAVTSVCRGDPKIMVYVAQDLVLAQAGKRMTRKQYERALRDAQELKGGW